MTQFAILACTAGLLIVSILVHRKRGYRSRLIHAAVCALFVAMLLRAFAPDSMVYETAIRLAFLLTQLVVVLLIFTFLSTPLSNRFVRSVSLVATGIAVTQLLLAAVVPTRPDGTVYMAYEVDGSWMGTLYYLAFFVPIGITTVTVGLGCGRAMFSRRQPLLARIALTCVAIGTVISMVFLVVSVRNILSPSPNGGVGTKNILLVVGLFVVLIGLAMGAVHRIVRCAREVLAWRAAQDIVLPLWRVATNLQPEVVLPTDAGASKSRHAAIVRLVVETHDALTLLRGDADPALAPVRGRYPADPLLSAGLLLHLAGPDTIPPPKRSAVLLGRLTMAKEMALADSVEDLSAIRIALAERDRWWNPALANEDDQLHV